MAKKKRQNGTLGCSNPRRNRRIDDPFRSTLLNVGSEAGTQDPTTAAANSANMTVDEIEVKVAMQILRQLELMDLQQLIDTLDFINSRQEQAAREDEPLDLGDLDMEEVPS